MTETEIANLALLELGVTVLLTDIATDTTPAGIAARLVYAQKRDSVLRDFPWPFARSYAALDLVDINPEPAAGDWLYAYRWPADALTIRRLTAGGRTTTEPRTWGRGRNFRDANDNPLLTVTLSTGAGWTVADLITVTALAGSSVFHDYDIGNSFEITNGGDSVRILVTEYVSATVVRGTPSATVAAGLRATALSTWSRVYDGKLVYANESAAGVEYTTAVTDPEEFDADFIDMFVFLLAAALASPLTRVAGKSAECLGMYERLLSRAQRNALNEGQSEKPEDAEWITDRDGSGSGRGTGARWSPLAGGGTV